MLRGCALRVTGILALPDRRRCARSAAEEKAFGRCVCVHGCMVCPVFVAGWALPGLLLIARTSFHAVHR
jgi:hypothetical protein